MKLTDLVTECMPDGSLHELARYACGCADDTYETPAGHVMPGPLMRYCAEHGGPRAERPEPWGFSCGTTLPQRDEP